MRFKLEYLIAIGVVLVVWQIAAVIAGEIVIASPILVFKEILEVSGDLTFWKHVGMSISRISVALILSFITAVPLGLSLGLSSRIDKYAKPFIYLSYPVPKIVLLPVVMLIFGLGEVSKIAMLWMILFFQLLITTRDAARGVDKAARYSLMSLGGNNWHMFRHVIAPSCLPAIITALRITAGTVVAVLFFVESIGTNWGLGFFIIDAWGRANIPQIFVGIVFLAGIGIVLYESFDLMEKTFCKWKQI